MIEDVEKLTPKLNNCRSLILKSLYNAMSKLMTPGPVMEPVAAFPKNPAGGATKALVLNHSVTVFGTRYAGTRAQGLDAWLDRDVPVASPGSSAKPL